MNGHLKEGGPAFPFYVDNRNGEEGTTAFGDQIAAGKLLAYSGMSMRDYCAIHASDTDVRSKLAEMACSPAFDGVDSLVERSLIARYAVADAMLKVRAS